MVVVPTIIERNPDSEHVYDLYSCLLKERIILMSGEINDAMSSSICAQLLYLSSIGKEPIQIYMNSCGGSITAGLAIYDIMRYVPCEISTICMGICASMAAVLLGAGTSGKRLALQHGEIMIHQPLGGMQGQAADMEIAMHHMRTTRDRLYAILSHHTGKTIAQIRTDCDRDHYMSAQEAVQYGLIDAVVAEKDI